MFTTIKLVFASQKKSKVDEEKYYDGEKLHFLTNLPDPFFPKKPTPPVRIQTDKMQMITC